MKKVLFFPYHPDLLTLLEYKHNLTGFQICGFSSFKEDAARVGKLNEAIGATGFSYEKMLNECDCVVMLDNYRGFRVDKYYQVIEDALRLEKEVIVAPSSLISLNLNDYDGRYKLLELLPDGIDSFSERYEQDSEVKVYDIKTPIIGVLGLGKHCGKFNNLLLLKKTLDKDYNAIAIASNALGALFGCYTYPSFLYGALPFQEKIVKLNHYIWAIAKAHSPDIMALGVPEGIMPFAKQEYHHFAEYPLVISNAVPIDIALLCTYYLYGDILEAGLQRMIDFCMQRFSIPVGAIAISKTRYELPQNENEKVAYEFLSDFFISRHYPNIDHIRIPISSPLPEHEAEDAIKACISLLEKNVKGI